MGLFKKLIVGFFILLVLGIIGAFGMQYYYETFYEKVPVEVKSDTVSGEVFYLSHTLEPGTYKIEAGGTGIVKAIKILDPDTKEIISTYEDSTKLIYGSAKPFVVRIDYAPPNPGESYTATVGIYLLVKE
ncbi:hypothetical protein OCC_08884 [Thermococcus litoralis DSM 5473]|uniref:Uncharacterized protein n=1 Tax=Thermococcus litoralis (strain ATCC 51850 / DSM 5473 / JCM 8560 / NS-C) TaxID=523849 RepID=H3ZKA1_THELN|nr:hypothetical protein [Thermococcus litoralis]EHR79654.1 hypothetical protein OCC_08884 [Thermococcus litoralis DSM 5473]